MGDNDPGKGVIVAQGNKTNGYSLYVGDDKKLYFQINQNNASFIIQTKDPVSGKFNVIAKFLKGGIMEMYVDGKEAATGKTKGLFNIPLRSEGIRIANDYWRAGVKKAGNYADSARNIGKVSDARMETLLTATEKVDLGKPDAVIALKTIQHEMKFDKPQLTAKAGAILEIVFTNNDFMQHNLLVLKPGSMDKVGAAATGWRGTVGIGMFGLPEGILYAACKSVIQKFGVPDIPGYRSFFLPRLLENMNGGRPLHHSDRTIIIIVKAGRIRDFAFRKNNEKLSKLLSIREPHT